MMWEKCSIIDGVSFYEESRFYEGAGFYGKEGDGARFYEGAGFYGKEGSMMEQGSLCGTWVRGSMRV